MRSALATTAALGLMAGALAAAPQAAADPVMHHIRYTVTADGPIWSHIYYRDTEPAVFSDYSHNPYVFSPRADVDLAPDRPWVLETSLADPEMWAMVTVQSAESPNFTPPAFNCTLEVDGVVVATDSGPKGALCSLRPW
ncbi:hypothetical protein [Mycolicibacterium confluentis]|uniref:Uncharacterized protein n=1 Tax=Mycolicibacterium confluentis TaxID=28047 RepID=A0A7I7XTW6_9MYCO|nr:hypothetical protein [Mycolicibacterium confluentis]MCV7322091.1 hypothetical protein [Mycolicibacterium confluentis]ORV27798.1 hypothetical protein AWB99_19430 [Mycolicibacterium confluentis]BBZ32574.1 hypothetical protein MCNF_11790 [Mycolicibacterium confluentis]